MKKSHLILFGLLLSFTVNATNDIPRPEYPRPQFERTEWINLNGTWTYEFDLSNSGKNRKLFEAKSFNNTITVPFCPESKLSGVSYTDFINQMWYQRSLSIPAEWQGKKILLNFGAVDYLQSPNQKIPDRKTKCVIKTHINIKQNVIFGAKLKPV